MLAEDADFSHGVLKMEDDGFVGNMEDFRCFPRGFASGRPQQAFALAVGQADKRRHFHIQCVALNGDVVVKPNQVDVMFMLFPQLAELFWIHVG